MEAVAKRDKATLLPIIEKIVRPGSIIYSNEWRAYSQIQEKLGFQHQTVNHSANFVDPATGVHTQAIESYWAKAKYKFKVMKSVSAESLPSYLDERMWRDRWGTSTEDAFNNLCKCIAEQYPVLRNRNRNCRLSKAKVDPSL
jgi:transposase-like protein